MAERARPDPGNTHSVWSIEVDPDSGQLLQDGRKVGATTADLVAALRKALAADHAKASAIVDALSEPIMVFDREGNLEWCNSYAEFTFGAGAVVRGTPCHLLVCDKPEPCGDCPVQEFSGRTRNPGTVRVRRDLRTSEGDMQPFELTLRRLHGPNERPSTVVFLRDIGEESAQELKLRERIKRDDLRLEISDMLLSSPSLGEMVADFGDRTAKALGLSTVSILIRAANGWLVPAILVRNGKVEGGTPAQIAAGNLGLKATLDQKRTVLVRDVDKAAGALSLAAVLERSGGPSSGSMVVAPLVCRTGEVLGALVAGRAEVDGFEQEEVELVRALAARLGLAVGGAMSSGVGARVMRLQKALIDLGEVMAVQGIDFQAAARRVLEALTTQTGLSFAAAVLYNPFEETVTLSHLHSRTGGHVEAPVRRVPVSECAFTRNLLNSGDVAVIQPPMLLAREREDPIVARLLQEGEHALAFVPTGVDATTLGWFVLGVPDPLWFSTPTELEVLRGIGQQTRIALSWLISDGRLEDLFEAFGGKAPRSG